MTFRILGDLGVVGSGGPLPMTSHRQRVTLLMLLLAANHEVAIDRLAQAIWDESPPVTAREQHPGEFQPLARGAQTRLAQPRGRLNPLFANLFRHPWVTDSSEGPDSSAPTLLFCQTKHTFVRTLLT